MRYILVVILLIFLGALGIFAVQNLESISVRFLTWDFKAPFAFLAVVIYVLGMLSGWSVVGFLRRSIRHVSADSPRV